MIMHNVLVLLLLTTRNRMKSTQTKFNKHEKFIWFRHRKQGISSRLTWKLLLPFFFLRRTGVTTGLGTSGKTPCDGGKDALCKTASPCQ